jgi:hypothetical protein
VVDELADGPAAFAVRSVELFVAETFDDVAKFAGHVGDGGDGTDVVVAGDGSGAGELSDGVARVEIGHGVGDEARFPLDSEIAR